MGVIDYTDGIAEKDIYAAQYNDDRLGRNLDKLFEADRSSMLTELSANAIKLHNFQTDDNTHIPNWNELRKLIEKCHEQLTAISKKFNKYKLKSKEQVEAAIKKACRGAFSFFDIDFIEEKKSIKIQISPGRSGPNIFYIEIQVISFKLELAIKDAAVEILK